MSSHNQPHPSWYERVVEGGYCIGCGACSSVDEGLEMRMNAFGLYQPEVQNMLSEKTGDVCPFYAKENENGLAERQFPLAQHKDIKIGKYEAVYIGHVSDENIRGNSSSGGIVTWLLLQLLKRDMIDAVIHVAPTHSPDPLFRYGVSETAEDIKRSTKSRYYPVEFSQAVEIAKNKPGRYAFVGVPCYVKAMRLLAKNDPILDEKLKYCVSIFCGHMKTAAFGEYFAWQQGVNPKDVTSIDFRQKLSDRPANQYGVKIDAHDGSGSVGMTTPTRELHGHDWGLGLFKPKACDFCDDIAGETADISCGDAWLRNYIRDPGGNSVIVVRNKQLQILMSEARESGELDLDDAEAMDVFNSQAGNYRHRQEGLSFRLAEADKEGIWRPQKRIEPNQFQLGSRRLKIYKLRASIARKSHHLFLEAKRKNSVGWFKRKVFIDELRYYSSQGFKVFARFIVNRIKKNIKYK